MHSISPASNKVLGLKVFSLELTHAGDGWQSMVWLDLFAAWE